MDFSLTDDQIAMQQAVRRFCDREYPGERRGEPEPRALAAARWRAMAGLGLQGLPFDPALGGSGQSAVETMLVAHELGRALGGGAWIPCVVLAGGLIAAAGTRAQRDEWLAALCRGDLEVALAIAEPGARYDLADVRTRARRVGSGYLLDGDKTPVLHGESAGVLLVVARTAGEAGDRDGLSVLPVDPGAPGVRVAGFATLDGRRAAHVELRAVHVPEQRVVGEVDRAFDLVEHAVDRALAAWCAEAAGAIDAVIELTAEHLRTRVQFGVPLASQQALQHRLADMLIALEQAKSMACASAMAVDEAAPSERRRLVSAARVVVGRAARSVSQSAIQMHGAMGMTAECRIGHYAKRLLVVNQLFGDVAHHLRRYAGESHRGDREPVRAPLPNPRPGKETS